MTRNSPAPLRRPAPRGVARATSLALLLICAAGALTTARAQSNAFRSGSTGADGAFAPTESQTIVVPESGVFNFTTVNIPDNVFITFARNSKNTPVTILASGNVIIAGQIWVRAGNAPNTSSGGGGLGGPGGFDGGFGGCPNPQAAQAAGTRGDGPGGGGGGAAGNDTTFGGGGGGGFSARGADAVPPSHLPSNTNGGTGGARYGTPSLIPLVGGSGGGGGGANTSNSSQSCGGGGGGGGGAIVIASSGAIEFRWPGGVFSEGGQGGNTVSPGGGGSGGAIRLVANTIWGPGQIRAQGGGGSTMSASTAGKGADGYIRIEAYDFRNFQASVMGPQPNYALPNPVAPSNAPRLRIVSVSGVAAPASPLGAMHAAPDIVLPTTQTGPVEVVIEGSNIATGTALSVTVTPERGTPATVQSGGLTGTEAASTARASVSLPAGVSVVSATAVVDLMTAKAEPLFIDGERVTRVEIAATFGGASEVTYVTGTGRRLKKRGE